MRRLAAVLAAFALSGGVLLGVAAAPAQAHYPNGTLRNVYSDYDFCHWYGNYGVQNDMWSSYICERHVYPPTTYWFFWTFD